MARNGNTLALLMILAVIGMTQGTMFRMCYMGDLGDGDGILRREYCEPNYAHCFIKITHEPNGIYLMHM